MSQNEIGAITLIVFVVGVLLAFYIHSKLRK